jgi:hypothetical protein
MTFLNKIFGQFGSTKLIEPIFPGENFSLVKLNMRDGVAFATVNQAYKNYPNKKVYPFLVGIELEVVDKNDNGHPVEAEASRLNQIQDEIETLLKQKQTVHSVARVTRNGARDILIYIDKPKVSQDELDTFFKDILKERQVNLSIKKDVNWIAVSGLLEQSLKG